mgnify:CR=1 FL=1|jgi:hypothetical protein
MRLKPASLLAFSLRGAVGKKVTKNAVITTIFTRLNVKIFLKWVNFVVDLPKNSRQPQ